VGVSKGKNGLIPGISLQRENKTEIPVRTADIPNEQPISGIGAPAYPLTALQCFECFHYRENWAQEGQA
jgi:hypothetical protein